MPMSDWAYGPDAWHLVNYVRSLSSDTQRRRVEMKKFTIEAVRVKTLPDHLLFFVTVNSCCGFIPERDFFIQIGNDDRVGNIFKYG